MGPHVKEPLYANDLGARSRSQLEVLTTVWYLYIAEIALNHNNQLN